MGGQGIDVERDGDAVGLKRTPSAEEVIGRFARAVHVKFEFRNEFLEGRATEFPEEFEVSGLQSAADRLKTENSFQARMVIPARIVITSGSQVDQTIQISGNFR